ncbi:MAG: APC family permease [Anaerolineales bacterium]|nr:MAG: APC family permease [Anaerolineales bacterium]
MNNERMVIERTTSGMVRQLSWWDGFLSNIGTMNLFWIAVSFMWATGLFPGSDLVGAMIVTTILMIPHIFVYTQFAAAMPRSGGDYVFNSRTLHPSIGFALNFSMVVWNMFWMGYTAYQFATAGVSTTASLLGHLFSNNALINFGGAIGTTPSLALLIGAITIIIVGALALWGNKPFFRAMSVAFVIGLLGVVAMVVVLLLSNNQGFVETFNKFAFTTTEIPNYYDAVMKVAADTFGFVKSSPKFFSMPTLIVMMFAFQPLGFAVWSSYLSGEIKNANSAKVHARAMVGSLLFTGIFIAIVGALLTRVLGYNFLGATGLYYHNWAELEGGIINNAYFYVALLVRSPIFQLIIGLSLMAWTFLYIQPSLAMVSRCFFAWSIDGLAPKGLKHVNRRSHVPDVSIIVACLIAIAFLAKFCWPGEIFSIYGANAFVFGGAMIFASVAVSAIIFPFSKKTKRLYELSPIQYKIGNFPLMSLFGILSLLYMTFVSFLFCWRPEMGVLTVPSIVFSVLLVVVGFIWYFVALSINKAKGIDTAKVLSEIPQD